MAYELNGSHHELYRPHNPWERFTQRHDENHLPEDRFRLVPPPHNVSTSAVIDALLTHDQVSSPDQPIPRRRQLLRDFLSEAVSGRGLNCHVDEDIVKSSSSRDIALLDDRQKHEGCAKPIGKQCDDCQIYSNNVTIPNLYLRLKEEVSTT